MWSQREKYIADKTQGLEAFFNFKLCLSPQKSHTNLHKVILAAQLERTVKNEISCSFTRDDLLQTHEMPLSFELSRNNWLLNWHMKWFIKENRIVFYKSFGYILCFSIWCNFYGVPIPGKSKIKENL